jgi:hypothetical protein
MARWPDVPAVFGWLSLDRRGHWRLKGKKIDHPNSVAFINRNYLGDALGRFYFQNGPQQVFVELEFAPYILFPADNGNWVSHNGQMIQMPEYAWIDEDGNMGLMSALGLGLFHDQAVLHASSFLCDTSGHSLSDTALEAALELFTNMGTDDTVRLRVGEHLLKVKSIRRSELEGWGQFIKIPDANEQG